MKNAILLLILATLASCGGAKQGTTLTAAGAPTSGVTVGNGNNSGYLYWKSLPGNSNKTPAEYLVAFKGETGATGPQGAQGATGLSAYEFWKTSLPATADKSPAAYLEAIRGPQGIQGTQGETGLSAYEYWKTTLPATADKSPAAYLEAIRGAQGSDGKSAYDIFKANNPDSTLTETQWLASLQGATGPQGPAGTGSTYSIDTYLSNNNNRGTRTTWKQKYTYLNSDGSSYNNGSNDYTNDYSYDDQIRIIKNSLSTSSTGDRGELESAPVNKNLAIIETYGYDVSVSGATYEVVYKMNELGGFDTVKYEWPNYGYSLTLVDKAKFDQLYPTFSHNDVLNFIESSPSVTNQDGYIFKDNNSGNYYFDTTVESSKDVEFVGARIESAKVDEVKGTLLQYGLSSERTEKLSKLLVSYKQISNKRALNASEKDQFTKELLGMTFNQAAKEMVQDYDGLIEKAAKKNGASPEAVKDLVSEFVLR